MADLEIAGGGDFPRGSEQSAAQWPPDDRNREAPEVMRGWGMGGFGGGEGGWGVALDPLQKGGSGISPQRKL